MVGDRVRIDGDRRLQLNGKTGTVVDGMVGVRPGVIPAIVLQFATVVVDGLSSQGRWADRYIIEPENLTVIDGPKEENRE